VRFARRRLRLAGAVAVVLAATGVATATAASAATGCQVTYTITNQWPGGFGADVAVVNLGDSVTSWRLTWSFTAGQTITQLWGGTFSQAGSDVTVVNAGWNGALSAGAGTALGFNGSWNGASNPIPTGFALNGTTCTGGTASPSGTPPTASASGTPSVPPPSSHTPSPSSSAQSPSEPPNGSDATVVPDASWTCGMPDGIAPPARGQLVLRATLRLGAVHDVGTTQYGRRRVIDVTDGTFTGDRVSGTVLTGGLDLELTLSNGAVELEEIDMLRTGDGTLIYLRSCGVAPAGDSTVRIVPDFEAPNSSAYAWLNTGTFAGTRVINAAAGTIELAVYDVSTVTPADPRIRLKDPEGVPNQSWACSAATGTRGAAVFSESVTLGSGLTVGASKRGTRNVIPITGGTASGRVTGSVLPGGADYQLIGSSVTLDARYTLSTTDGEFILVRNCGPIGQLVPVFETRAAGAYAFLNANTWLSSDPTTAAGGVGLTFYERK